MPSTTTLANNGHRPGQTGHPDRDGPFTVWRDHTLMIDAVTRSRGHRWPTTLRVWPRSPTALCIPMAAAMNHIGYDAAALGNHEFNYGIPLLRAFAAQLDFPLLGAKPWMLAPERLPSGPT